MNELDTKYLVAFSRVPGIGRAKLALLETHFGELERAWAAGAQELAAAGLEPKLVHEVVSRRPTLSPDDEMERLARHGVAAIPRHDRRYPHLLKEIDDPPAVLYVKGSILPQDSTSLAVVGTRRATVYGKEVTTRITADLVRAGVTITSGLAKGIDTAAHRSALDAGGRTIAVFGCGLDIIYPMENTRLAAEISDHGALISEHPLGVKPERYYFPQRNRIMSGISLGVLVVEGELTSGARITVDMALEQGREVFAVPGSIFSRNSELAHRRIQEGAKLVTKAEDILEELNLAAVGQQLEMKALLPQSDDEDHLIGLLSAEPRHIDEITRLSRLPISTVSSTLAMMELKGVVRQVGQMSYVVR
ncbi:MAG: DNA-protecting protein DprA [Dehalococcoidia bacterium]|nr:DNA-protecting protein DprA [Dehalococcoidia bacterium]